MVRGGEEVLLEFESFDPKPINLTFWMYNQMSLQEGSSYYLEYFENLKMTPIHFLIPKSSYSFFYTCNSEHQYEANEDASLVGNIDLGFGKL